MLNVGYVGNNHLYYVRHITDMSCFPNDSELLFLIYFIIIIIIIIILCMHKIPSLDWNFKQELFDGSNNLVSFSVENNFNES